VTQCVAIPARARWIWIQAINAAGLRSFPVYRLLRVTN
jgi:hypothetical protein